MVTFNYPPCVLLVAVGIILGQLPAFVLAGNIFPKGTVTDVAVPTPQASPERVLGPPRRADWETSAADRLNSEGAMLVVNNFQVLNAHIEAAENIVRAAEAILEKYVYRGNGRSKCNPNDSPERVMEDRAALWEYESQLATLDFLLERNFDEYCRLRSRFTDASEIDGWSSGVAKIRDLAYEINYFLVRVDIRFNICWNVFAGEAMRAASSVRAEEYLREHRRLRDRYKLEYAGVNFGQPANAETDHAKSLAIVEIKRVGAFERALRVKGKDSWMKENRRSKESTYKNAMKYSKLQTGKAVPGPQPFPTGRFQSYLYKPRWNKGKRPEESESRDIAESSRVEPKNEDDESSDLFADFDNQQGTKLIEQKMLGKAKVKPVELDDTKTEDFKFLESCRTTNEPKNEDADINNQDTAAKVDEELVSAGWQWDVPF